MKVFNTMTRQKEELVPLTPGEFKIYACGPTVYNFIHIGNARPLVVFDTLRRYLEWRGYEVNFVQNFTDIDDKIIRRANEEGLTFREVAEKYIGEFWTDAKGLGVREATTHPKATENIDTIIDIVSRLVERGYAYRAENGDVYFRTRKFDEYGKLSHQPIDDLESGARIAVGEVKEDPLDFALWKAAKEGEPSWPSPWSDGRPGWHIECSAMSRRYLGPSFDIHGGGLDLRFPHHENELAQSTAAGDAFAGYWVHNGLVTVGDQKMSKSLGNFLLADDVLRQYEPLVVRYALAAAHYRSNLDITAASFDEAAAALDRIRTFQTRAARVLGAGSWLTVADLPAAFATAMDDDLGVPQALAVVHEHVRAGNAALDADDRDAAARAAVQVGRMTGLLGLNPEDPQWRTGDGGAAASALDALVQTMITQRAQARIDKDWPAADRIRDAIAAAGITLEDTPDGTHWSLNG